MKTCSCGNNMEVVKFIYEYKFECSECGRVEDINEEDLEEVNL